MNKDQEAQVGQGGDDGAPGENLADWVAACHYLTSEAVRAAIGAYENEEISFGRLLEIVRAVAVTMDREFAQRPESDNEGGAR